MSIRIEALGGLKVLRDGTELKALPGQTLRCALLLHLAVEGRAPREALMGLLWPDRSPERARHSLSQTLYELRRDVGQGCVEASGEVLRVGSGVSSDVAAFRDGAETGDRARALDAYRGHFLEGVHLAPSREFEAWVDRVRSRLQRLHRKTRSGHLEDLLDADRTEEALAQARRWVELDPLDDEAQHHVIRLLAESGHRTQALQQFERYRRLIARELDVEPLEQVRELVERIRDRSAVEPPGGRSEPVPDPEPAGEDRSPVPGAVSSGEDVGTSGASRIATPTSTSGDRAGGNLWTLVQEARIPRILGVYVLASFGVLQLVDILVDRLRLPDGLFAVALVLVLAGLPVVVTTALIQTGALRRLGDGRGWIPGRWIRLGGRWFTWRNAVLAGVAAAGVWMGYALLVDTPEAVATEAEIIAVLPFTASGEGVEDFGKGIVSLLGPNLDGVGGIRTIDSRTVIRRWEEHADGAGPDFRGALDVGSEVGAGSVVLGSVVALGERVRLLAELYSVEGERLARADTEGDMEEVLSLVDSLSVRLIRSVWRSREPIPEVRVSAVTTGSLPAMRAFLRGEEHYRQTRLDEAVAAFQRAVERDSTFALAQFRLAEAEFWAHRGFTPEVLAAMDAAYRNRERLPSRERTLVVARRLDLAGDPAAVDTLSAYVRRYPEDGEGWFYLGDVRFHARRWLAPEPEEVFRPFERAVDLVPGFSAALVHPLQWSLVLGDSARYDRYLRRFRDGAGDRAAEPYERWQRILWGPTDSVDLHLDALLAGHAPGVWRPLLDAAFNDPDFDPGVLAGAMGREMGRRGREDPGWTRLARARAATLLGLGRIDGFRRAVEELRRVDASLAARLEVRALLADPPATGGGVGSVEDVPGVRGGQEPDPGSTVWRALRDVGAGRIDAARSRMRAAPSPDDGPDPDDAEALLEATAGWARVVEGDTVAGLAALESGLRAASYWWSRYPHQFLGYVRARTQSARPVTREEGIRRIRYLAPPPELVAPSRIPLARALEAVGDEAGARAAYRHYLHLRAGADSVYAPRIRDVQRALRRLEDGG